MIVLDKQSYIEYATNLDLHIYKYCILFKGAGSNYYDIYFHYSELSMVIKLYTLLEGVRLPIFLYEPKDGSISLPGKIKTSMAAVITYINNKETTPDAVIKSTV